MRNKMAIVLIAFLMLNAGAAYSQKKITAYFESRASVDLLGNINMGIVSKPKKMFTAADSLVSYASINKIISALRTPPQVLNALADEGWTLVSVTHVLPDKEGRPNTPFLLYYFKKEFVIDKE